MIIQEQQHYLSKSKLSSVLPRSITGIDVGSSGGARATCLRHQNLKGNFERSRQRHNATQTLESSLHAYKCYSYNCNLHNCQHTTGMCCHSCGSNNDHCFQLTNTTTDPNCFQQLQPSKCLDHFVGDSNTGTDVMCHCHITHHCHHYSPSDRFNRSQTNLLQQRQNKRRLKHCSKHRLQMFKQQPPHQHRDLPTSKTKSSLSSDEKLSEQNQHLHCQSSSKNNKNSSLMQDVAIEIDAATSLTENNNYRNSSTGTSDFSFKMAKSNDHDPIIMAPMNNKADSDLKGRRSLKNSNTTLETTEDSNSDSEVYTRHLHRQKPKSKKRSNIGEVANDLESYTPIVICCNDTTCCRIVATLISPAATQAHNERVKIKRKRFISQEHCSSCSKCSSCSCHMRTSSCSSIDDFEVDHEMTVSVDCHRCHLQPQSSDSSVEASNDEDGNHITQRIHDMKSVQLRASRRSSRESFCSCNSTSCCYCSCDDCDTSHAKIEAPTKRVNAADMEEQHSRTLTPITNSSSVVSTPLAEDAITLRSMSTGIEEDSISQSQSAEYFSLSSNQPSLQQKIPISPTRIITVPPVVTTARKQCKHYSKHHRHKLDSPVSNYL